jgi:hypothetical protein
MVKRWFGDNGGEMVEKHRRGDGWETMEEGMVVSQGRRVSYEVMVEGWLGSNR